MKLLRWSQPTLMSESRVSEFIASTDTLEKGDNFLRWVIAKYYAHVRGDMEIPPPAGVHTLELCVEVEKGKGTAALNDPTLRFILLARQDVDFSKHVTEYPLFRFTDSLKFKESASD